MIYWPRQAEEFTIVIPNASGYKPAADDPALWLEVRNNVGLQEFPGVLDGAAVTARYISMTFIDWGVPDEMPDGEYDYALRLGAEGPVISCGLLIVGDYQPAESIQYDKPTTYEQYQPE